MTEPLTSSSVPVRASGEPQVPAFDCLRCEGTGVPLDNEADKCGCLKWSSASPSDDGARQPPLRALIDALAVLEGCCGADDRTAAYAVAGAARAYVDSLPAASAEIESLKAPQKLEKQDYALIAEAVEDFLGFDITTREQQDRITRWASASPSDDGARQSQDVVCEHGAAMDVHCCNCHSGFIFDYKHECPEPPNESVIHAIAVEAMTAQSDPNAEPIVYRKALIDICNIALKAQARQPQQQFQQRVLPWLLACFGAEIANDKTERVHRFIEEALELTQSCGCTASEAHQLVDYVFARPVGELQQEVGGTMVTLAALCLAHGVDMHAAGEDELTRVWGCVEKIRAKQAAKPKHSPLPAAASDDGAAREPQQEDFEADGAWYCGRCNSPLPPAPARWKPGERELRNLMDSVRIEDDRIQALGEELKIEKSEDRQGYTGRHTAFDIIAALRARIVVLETSVDSLRYLIDHPVQNETTKIQRALD